ncbi:TonB-dependent receptor [Fulvivirga kasyanovii]|uniref:TonB-dependent receptor n=1 Tax=Fulvivirga kasyanovii TaxID=396812 RepID=A0ABW9RT78_9BACT|nr:TonB-dependent receptor [Fulvivirga kasyanovii]MTI27383.1 TonB-dependent receptor [Fulvivirga kasyanovii]
MIFYYALRTLLFRASSLRFNTANIYRGGLVLLTCFWVSGVLHAQSAKGTIEGKVLDEKSEPVPFAYVIIESTDFATTTDAEGYYILKNVPEGEYKLTVRSMGFTSQTKAVTVKGGKSYSHGFTMAADVQQLDEVQVWGKSEATAVREQSYAVSSIDAKPLQNLNLDVNQVLAKSTGVRIRETGGLGSRFDFSLNGFNGNQVRFFLDGVPMENFGSSLTLNNLPVNMAERIEVYKGVVPVWLGSDALGGAVNIVTNQYRKTYLDVSYSYGSFNTHRSSINGSYTNDKTGFTVRANLFQNYSDNSYKVNVNKKRGSVILKETEEVERFHDAYDSKSAIVDVGLVNKSFADQLLVGIILSESEKEQQTGATMEKVYGQRLRKSSTVMPTFRYKKSNLFVEGLELNGFASYNFGYVQTIDTASRTYYWDGTYIEKADPTDGELNRTLYKFKDNSFIGRANLSYVLNDKHSFVVNYTVNNVDRKGEDEANPLELSNKEPKVLTKTILGAGYKFDWKERLTVSLFAKNYMLDGVTYYTINIYTDPERVERSLQQSQLGYGTAFSYRIPRIRLQIKGSVEKAYRMPEAYELFGDGANVAGNVLLEPEESMNYNVGALYQLNFGRDHIFNFEANYLQRNVDQFIRASVGTSDPTSTFTNEAAVKVAGVEGSMRYAYKSLFSFSANVTYQKQRNDVKTIDGKPNPLYNNQVPNQPYLFANANALLNIGSVKYSHDKLGIGYGVSFFEEYFLYWAKYGSSDTKKTIPRQFSHNVDVNYSLHKGKYNVSLSCNNLFDAELYDNFKLQKPGRAYYVKLRYFFQK